MLFGTSKGAVVLVLLATSIACGVALVPHSSRPTTVAPLASLKMDARRFRQLVSTMADDYEIRELEFGLFRLNAKQLFEFGITEVDSGDGPEWAVEFSKVTDDDTSAISDTLSKIGVPCMGSCGHGYAGWYVERQHFFAARRALLASSEVRSLGIKVVTPRFR